MNGLTNNYVQTLSIYLTSKKFFWGTFPCNELPRVYKKSQFFIASKKPFSMIINLSPNFTNGSHFVALMFKNDKLILFDSLNLQFADPNIEEFVKKIIEFKSSIQYYTSNVQIQNFKSSMCGFYCIAWITYMFKCRESPIKCVGNFLKKFDDQDTVKNDKIIVNLILKYIKKT